MSSEDPALLKGEDIAVRSVVNHWDNQSKVYHHVHPQDPREKTGLPLAGETNEDPKFAPAAVSREKRRGDCDDLEDGCGGAGLVEV